MSKNTSLLLIIWNIVLTALVVWGLTRRPAAVAEPMDDTADTELADLPPVAVRSDTAALNEARIAYFIMDSVQKDYELIAEKDRRFRSEGQRLEKSLQDEMAKAQARYEQLMKKDHTYSTKAEVAQDEAELQGLMAKIQGQQASSEEQLARMEATMLTEITNELKDYLENYNKNAGFDYIFSVQNGGQIWVGNKDLNITSELVAGLNARYRAGKK
jgi:outer membrane protein